MLHAAGNFPIGLSSSGTPTSLQVVGPPGYDSTILSLLMAMEKLFGDFPAPPNPSLCAGCVSNVSVRTVGFILNEHPCHMYMWFDSRQLCIWVGLGLGGGEALLLQLFSADACH